MNHIRSRDVFLVGHPKSGMTWLEFMLAHLLPTGRRQPPTVRDLDRHVPNLAAFGPGDTLKLWPHALRPSPRLFFTHTRFDPRLTRGRIVYMLRDPRDVIVSYYHYRAALETDAVPDLVTFVADEVGKPDAWSEHVEGWVGNRDIPHFCLVRYEQLLTHTRSELVRVASFMDLAFDDRDIDRALEAGRFEHMRRNEEKFPSWRRASNPDFYHCRKGLAGGWREELPPDAREIIETGFAATMREVGYATDTTLRKAG